MDKFIILGKEIFISDKGMGFEGKVIVKNPNLKLKAINAKKNQFKTVDVSTKKETTWEVGKMVLWARRSEVYSCTDISLYK